MTETVVKALRVSAPHFVAGVELTNGVCTTAAPIVRYFRKKSEDFILKYCQEKKWKVEHL
jgi:hypothetical protein